MKFMDLLFKRYADPFSLLNGYIQTCRFTEFVISLCKQKIEDDRWEFYLHKVYGKTYAEFCESLQVSQSTQQMSDAEMETTIRESQRILGNFHPTQGEGEVNGCI